ncbi:S8 family serine peptidase [Leptolyngbya sp. AN03gr2]|uniref:S8 family serine peptidase n=1 Tax=unclassified Leptolyngbya TaxID=2650499 RepID=UPI003D319689
MASTWSAIAQPTDLIASNFATGETNWFAIAENRIINRASLPISDPNLQVVDIYDYDRDGRSDLLWNDRRDNSLFFSNGQRLHTLNDLNWQIQRVGDFDRDNDRDILWRNQSTGQIALWQLNGMQTETGQILTSVDRGWKIADVQDYDSDGDLDLLWRHDRSGENVFWQMNGTAIERGFAIASVPDPNWKMIGSGDFNGDQKFDLFWQHHQSGQIVIWQMNGMSIEQGTPLSIAVDSSWQVKGIHDYNQDGTDDVLWQHVQSGMIQYWEMTGSQPQRSTFPATFNNWQIQSFKQSEFITKIPTYNSNSGYGIVNAGIAVAAAIGQAPFAQVQNTSWALDMMNIPEVWARGYTGQGITIAVIDSGIDLTHSDLRSNLWTNSREIAGNGVDDDRNGFTDDIYGWNFSLNNNDVSPSSAHGTAVSGIITAARNEFGITGVAYNSKLMPIRVTNAQDNWNGNLANAIRYAVDNGARVINLSLWWTDSPQLRDALAYAASRNVITVKAALNEGASQPSNPARYATQFGIAVGAVDRDRRFATFSNRSGFDPQMRYVLAPGRDIETTIPGNTYQSGWWGTSMATPYISGVVALMLSANPNLTHDQVRQILIESTTDAIV